MKNNNFKKEKSYLDFVRDIIINLNEKGEITFANKEACEVLGYKREALIGKNWFTTCLPKSNKKEVKRVFKKIIVGDIKLVKHYDNEIITKKGEVKLISWYNTILHGKNGKIKGVLSSGQDITKENQTKKKLKDSEELLNKMGEVAKVGGWEMDLKAGGRAKWTKGTYDVVEIPYDHPVPGFKEHTSWYLPKYRQMVNKKMDEFAKTGKSLFFEAKFKTSKGNIKWGRAIGKAIKENGKIIKLIGTFQDITNEKELELKIKKNEQKFRAVFENSADGILAADKKTKKFVFANNAMAKMLGYSVEEILKLKINDIHPKKDLPRAIKDFKQATIKEVASSKGLPILRKDKKIVYCDISGRDIKIGEKKYTFGFFRDATKRKETEEKLIEEKEFSDLVIDGLPGVFFTLSKDGNFIRANKNLKKIFGHTAKEITKLNILSLFESEEAAVVKNKIKEVFSKGKSNLEANLVTKSGEKIPYYFTGLLAKNKDKKYLIASGVDISDRKKAEIALKKSEENYRTIFDSVNKAIFIYDIELKKIVDINKKAEELFGYKKREIKKIDIKKLISSGKYPYTIKNTIKQLKTSVKKPIIFEWQAKRKNGKLFWIEVNLKTTRIRSRDVIITLIKDITKEKEAEQKLEESEEKYRNLVERARDGIVIVQDKKIKYLNPQISKITGVDKKDVLNQPFINFIYPGERKKVIKRYISRMAGKKVDSIYETSLINLKKEKIDVEFNVGVVNYKSRPASLVFVHDITERNKTLNEIVEERDKINRIVHGIGDAVFVITKHQKIILFNKVAEELSGFSEKEAIGKKYNKILHFEDEKTGKTSNDFIKKTLEFGEKQTMQNHALLVHKDGSKTAVADSSAPIKDNQGNVTGCVVIFRDVTKERKADRAKTEFVSIASHQLRTPLSGIKWFSELILKENVGKLNKRQKDYIAQIYSSNERMIKLVEDLLKVSHIETGRKFIIRKKTSRIIETLKRVIKNNEAIINSKKITIKINESNEKDCHKLRISLDEEKIEQVLYNLITNAVKYSKDNGLVEIGCEIKDKNFLFKIKDYGWGIPRRQQKRVFEKFFRADNVTTKQTDGTGLGLYIAKAIVENHGGRIWFESKENVGTTFYFSLPTK